MNSQKLSLTLNVVLLIAVLYLFFKVSSLSSAVSGHHGETSVNSGNNPKDTGVKVNRVHEEDGQLVIRYVDIDSLNSQYELLKDAEKEFQALNKQAEAQYKGKIQAAQKRAQEIEKEFRPSPSRKLHRKKWPAWKKTFRCRSNAFLVRCRINSRCVNAG